MIATDPELVEPTPAERKFLERFFQEHKGAELSGVADTVLFEDENVKIWSLVLEPGQTSGLHRHDHHYYLCISHGDRIAAVMPEGDKASMYAATIPKGGNTVSIPKGTTEWAVNIGKETYREILIELKTV